MTQLGIICGSSLTVETISKLGQKCEAENEFGRIQYYHVGDCIILPRHGAETYAPPHEINYRANIAAMKDLGVEEIVAICSTGTLKRDVPLGTFILPDDVFCPWRRDSFFGNRGVGFSIPSVSSEVTDKLEAILSKGDHSYLSGGVYCQTLGPSFETKAEIAFMSSFCTVVGMTAAQEVFLACELGIKIALLCMVDNYAHGVAQTPLTMLEVQQTCKRNSLKVLSVLEDILNGYKNR